MPVRVALLHNIISPHVVPLFERLAQSPGIQLKVYFLAETDRNRRWETTIGHRFEYTVLPNWAIRLGGDDLFTFFVNPTVLGVLLRDGFDVLISVGWDSFAGLSSFALCQVLGKPFILWSGSTANEPSWRRRVSRPLVEQVVRRSASWIAYGSRSRDYLVQLGARAERVFMAYNTVDVEWFSARAAALRPTRADIRRDLGLDQTGPVVLYVGQLIERKGVRDLLAAHALVIQQQPNAQLVLIGYGQLEAELRARVAHARTPNVHFTGHVALPDLPRYYVAADVFALPSHEEVWGLVLNEAAASGLPLVTTEPVGASADLVGHGANGYVVPSADPAALAEALLQAMSRSSGWAPLHAESSLA